VLDQEENKELYYNNVFLDYNFLCVISVVFIFSMNRSH